MYKNKTTVQLVLCVNILTSGLRLSDIHFGPEGKMFCRSALDAAAAEEQEKNQIQVRRGFFFLQLF